MKTVLVTGHSRGIGLALTQALLSNDHQVVGISRTALERQQGLYQISGDLSDLDFVAGISKQLSAMPSLSKDQTNKTLLQTIDAIVCNAGVGKFGALENFSVTQIQQNLQLNLISPLALVRTMLPMLKTQQRSNIVFIGSESGLQAGRFGSIYSAAKFGLRGAAQSLRAECSSANCHVGIVNPGMVRTTFFNDLSFEPGPAQQHALDARQVADAVISLLDAEDNAVIEEITLRPLQHVVQKKS